MGKKMKNAPVYFAILQVRFNPIMALDTYVPQIQDVFRKHGFADFRTLVTSAGVINTETGEPQMMMQQHTRYQFANKDGTSLFNLDNAAISFQTTHYDVFETFSAQFFKGLEAAHKIVQFDFVDRIGIRYLNAIYPAKGKTLSNYLAPEVQGLADKISGSLAHGFSETMTFKNEIGILTRAIVRDGMLAFPPDIAPMPIEVKFQKLDGRNALIDTDVAFNSRYDFEIEKIKEHTNAIKKESEAAFKLAVTDAALKEWA